MLHIGESVYACARLRARMAGRVVRWWAIKCFHFVAVCNTAFRGTLWLTYDDRWPTNEDADVAKDVYSRYLHKYNAIFSIQTMAHGDRGLNRLALSPHSLTCATLTTQHRQLSKAYQ